MEGLIRLKITRSLYKGVHHCIGLSEGQMSTVGLSALPCFRKIKSPEGQQRHLPKAGLSGGF